MCGSSAVGASTAICHIDQGLRNDIEPSEIEKRRKEKHTMRKDQVYLSGDKGTYRSRTEAYVVKLYPITIK